MKRYWPLLALVLIPVAVWAQSYRTLKELQTTTRAMPTVASDLSVAADLSEANGWSITVCAPTGQTLAGGGKLSVYTYDPSWGTDRVSANPGLDMPITVTSTSCQGAPCRCQTFPDVQVVAKNVRRFWVAANGVTLTAGVGADGGSTASDDGGTIISVHYTVWVWPR